MYIVSRKSLEGLGSPLTFHKYALDFINLPPIGINAENLVLRCLSADKPEVSNARTVIEQAGFRVSFSGKDEFSDTISVSFVSTGEGATIEALQSWKELCCSTQTGGSVNPDTYKCTVLMSDLAYDNETVIKTYTLHGVFPQNIAFSDGYGTSEAAQNVNVTFSYDYFD